MTRFFASAAAVAILVLSGAASAQQTASPVDPAKLEQHIKVLSDDSFEGRGPATEGEKKSIAYIADQMKQIGLAPAGPNGSYFQDVPLNRFLTKNVTMSLTEGGQTRPLVQGEQAVLQTKLPRDHISIKDAPLVFVGYGVKAPERNWDDFKGVDLKGKIMMVLVNDPDFENPASTTFGGPAMTYYGRWTYKYQEAARQGALGTLIIHETGPASYGWNTVKNSNANAQFDIVRKDPTEEHAPMAGWIQLDEAKALFASAGLDFAAEKEKAKRPDFKPVEIKGAKFNAEFDVDHSTITSHNVAGILKGSKRPDETVIYSAHWDHLGVGLPDASGDRIYNGAVDNATGVADVLEIARAFKAAGPTDRSVLFLTVTAEEKGLLGSEYYANNPLVSNDKTAGVINLDAEGVFGPTRDVSVSGSGQVSLEDDIAAYAAKQGRTLSADSNPGAGHFYRSDHFPFAKAGVPAVSFNAGDDLVQGGKARGKQLADEYNEKRYHQPADEWQAGYDLTGQAQDMALVYALGRDLANSTRWPDWKPGSEFKALRDKSAAARAGS
jgi:Zn-dependent M28 family amino/carboxypeptidase